MEIYSHWGAYENRESDRPFAFGKYPRGSLVSEALAAGLHLGFVGDSDDHTGQPGNDFFWRLGGYPGGLTAVWAAELTPTAVWQALYNRSCYATTRARILVKFFVNGSMMGSELRLSSPDEKCHLQAEVYGTAKIEELTIIRNGQVLISNRPDCCDAQLSFVDSESLPEKNNGYYYYLRVKQQDGEMAWTSPVWVSLDSAPPVSDQD